VRSEQVVEKKSEATEPLSTRRGQILEKWYNIELVKYGGGCNNYEVSY